MKAIVYLSNSGYTKEYAEIIAKKCDIPAYSWKEAKTRLKRGDEIVYMSWVMASSIKGFDRANNRYAIKAVGAVGMMQTDEKNMENIQTRHGIKTIPFFYLQGGFDIKRLKGIYLWLMKRMSRSMLIQLKKIEDPSEDELKLIEMLQNGGSCVCEERAWKLIEWIKMNRNA